MPFALRIGPYRIGFFSNENSEPAHVHAIRDSSEAKFWLHPEARLEWNVGFADHELTRIRKIIEKNRDVLVEKWHEHHHR
jgi:hypothetical protein